MRPVAVLLGWLACAPAWAAAQRDEVLVDRVLGNVAELVTSTVDPEVPPGTIAVTVVDPQGSPISNQTVRLGVMEQSGARQSMTCSTDERGKCDLATQPTEPEHSYRVTISHEGARYGSAPFRLDPAQGQRVRVVRLHTTTDSRRVFQVLGRTMIEFREDRARISQETRLSNLGDATYVFPPGGLSIRLPEGFTGFETQASMDDQRVTATDEGLAIVGSIPPGRVALVWAYDIPVPGTTLSIEQAVPFATMEYQVISDHVEGMALEVEGFQVARAHDRGDRQFLVTGLMRRPGDPPLDPLRIHIRGIPGRGPLPYLAVAIAVLFGLLGVVLLRLPPGRGEALARARKSRQAELLDEIADLERQRAAEAVGPKFYEHRRRELTDELAIVLRMEREAAGH